MDKNKFNQRAAAALTTLNESEGGWSPRSYLMLGLQLELNEYAFLESVLVRSGLVTASNEVVTITSEGRSLARKIEEALKKS